MATYTVIGASGRIGRRIVEQLLRSGHSVRAVGRNRERLVDLFARAAEPLVADVGNVTQMTRALEGARCAYTMVPPNRVTLDYYGRIGAIIAEGLRQTGVSHVVNLSGVGAHLAKHVGQVSDFHALEQALNDVQGLSVLHLRAGFFMENLYRTIDGIRKDGVMSGLLRPDLAIPQIATRDIATVAANAMLCRDFGGVVTRELLGERDLDMRETARIVGKAIGRSELQYVQTPIERAERKLLEGGSEVTMVRHRLQMYIGFNDGSIRWLEERSAENTTPTSIETFVAEEFAPRFQAVGLT